MKGKLVENQVIFEKSRDVSKLYSKRFFGKNIEGKLYLNLCEALYLLELSKIEVEKDSKKLDFKELLNYVDEEDFDTKYKVYKDLRDRGLVVKTGFKYGSHFRVYRKGIEDHADYLVHAFPEKHRFTTYEIVHFVRMANTVNKEMIFAFVDEEGDVTYNKLERIIL
ncbi:MAG: tRNA-intron lyase [Candidatus Methanofastidiosia archaeon]